MTGTIQTVELLGGLVFLGIAVVGGDFTLGELTVPKVPGWGRVGAAIVGVLLLVPFGRDMVSGGETPNGSPSPGRPAVTPGPTAVPNESLLKLSSMARTIIDPKSEDCGLSFPVNPVSGPVSITSPASHAVISNTETVRGTVKLSPGQHLYLFDYSFGTCRYYFNPQGEVRSMHDGSWDAEPDLTGNIGEEQVEVVAVVVSTEADAAFREIDTYMHRRGDMSPFIFRLPDGADWVSIPVQVAAR